MSFFINAFQEGGLFMYFILIFGVFTAGFIVERTKALYNKQASLLPADFRKKIMEYTARGDFRGAENYAVSAAGQTPLGRITALGCSIRANGGGEEELQARMDEKLAHEISSVDRRTGFLAMFGNVATLLGLTGTIGGMIHSFSGVATANPSDRATLLSKGISEAMNCTAFGLVVAITALVAYAIFQNRTDRVVTDLTESTTEIYHDLLFLTESNRSASTGMGAEQGARAMPSAPSPALSV